MNSSELLWLLLIGDIAGVLCFALLMTVIEGDYAKCPGLICVGRAIMEVPNYLSDRDL